MPTEKAIFAAGRSAELAPHFRELNGVVGVICGFTGGHTDRPTAEQVEGDRTGHVEAVLVSYDPEQVSFRQLLDTFFAHHDPVSRNRQGDAVGTRFRSAIFATSKDQERQAREVIRQMDDSGDHAQPVVTEVQPARVFHPIEQTEDATSSPRA